MSSSKPPPAEAGPGPASAAMFSSDPRVHFSRASGKWEYEDDNGNEFEWNDLAKAWVPIVDEDVIKAQQAAYSVEGVDESTPVAAVLARENKKRKDKEVDYTSNTVAEVAGPSSKPGKKGAKRVKPTPADEADGSSSSSTPAPAPPPAPKKSTAVYVTNLPLDATATEIAETFSKCGIILLTPENEPKIKLYTDDQGNFKGEALVMYFKETSVELAITVLDESELRLGSGARMKVKRAEWGDGGGGGKGNGAGGDQQAGEKKPKKQMTEAEKKELNRRMRKMENKLTDWDSASDDEEGGFGPSTSSTSGPSVGGAPPAPASARTVVLKYMFTLEELDEDPQLLIELKEEVREEAESMGEVTNVTVWDKEEEGVMTVKFKDPLAARACVLKFNNRFFAQREILAYLHDNKTKFKRSGHGVGVDEEDEEREETARLEKFREYLEKEE